MSFDASKEYETKKEESKRTIDESSSGRRLPDPEFLSSDEVEVERVEVGLDLDEKFGDEDLGGDEGEGLSSSESGGSKRVALGRSSSIVGEELEELGLVSFDELGDVDFGCEGEVDKGSVSEVSFSEDGER